MPKIKQPLDDILGSLDAIWLKTLYVGVCVLLNYVDVVSFPCPKFNIPSDLARPMHAHSSIYMYKRTIM